MKRIKKCICLTLLLFHLVIFLGSCSLYDQLAEKLGYDTYDYLNEKVTAVLSPEGEEAGICRDVIRVLITGSGYLKTFENMGEAIEYYSDSVLTYMLENSYSKYSGNSELLKKAAEQYPELGITVLIPVSEYENTMYRFFGGDVKIINRDREKFMYLSRINAYTTMFQPEFSNLKADIIYISETERTYRVRFRAVAADEWDGIVYPEYFALIIKRNDGTYYIKKLLEGTAVKD
ncbi:MAG: hypothetical protein IJU57_04485 [Clostridia bacterium]|nr:hypothetical protein [Clostridia bacterium]